MKENIVRQEYDNIANIYDLRWNSYINKTLTYLKNWANISPQDTVLDVGCGTGEFESLILRDNPKQHITGVDISEQMLLVAKNKFIANSNLYPNIYFQIARASSLPFANHSFDIIVSASAFHFFDDPVAALAEMKRVLKPDGKVFILDWCKDYFFCRLIDLYLKSFNSAHKRCYTQAEFHKLLTSANFNIQRAAKFNFDVIWRMMVVEMKL
ncbi:MAG: class I SAM-dependent methyltransferase [Calothrix sp. FI2-JRJ7]|jgi:ubiquinone/menaquinone biosynthesis C-methylase UbiE|nr:class I SAM-dependent methyltransferase [Calothrix sp. FI2-JRJ7]